MAYYQANTKSPLFSDLRGLMLKTAGLVDVPADAIKPLVPKVPLSFTALSPVARNRPRATST
jgi:hypothetical protein